MDNRRQEKFYLDFLRKNQPLPSDDDISEEELTIYHEAIMFFKENPNKLCIPLFLNSFGYQSGFGLYQLVDEVLCQYEMDDVLEHLISALSNEKGSVQMWAANLATDYPSVSLLPHMERLLNIETPSELKDNDKYIQIADIKVSILSSLTFFEFPEVNSMIKKYSEKESDLKMLKIASELFQNILQN